MFLTLLATKGGKNEKRHLEIRDLASCYRSFAACSGWRQSAQASFHIWEQSDILAVYGNRRIDYSHSGLGNEREKEAEVIKEDL